MAAARSLGVRMASSRAGIASGAAGSIAFHIFNLHMTEQISLSNDSQTNGKTSSFKPIIFQICIADPVTAMKWKPIPIQLCLI
ncbi:hypothetical protein U9M48_043941 [Paspalum notatum var. saurae]|uniref:Uncharacterized protein n=1 Tax=Paspalum notatum var. saurae TaxID=547442 RepID=A0AAQ3UY77_PASNO